MDVVQRNGEVGIHDTLSPRLRFMDEDVQCNALRVADERGNNEDDILLIVPRVACNYSNGFYSVYLQTNNARHIGVKNGKEIPAVLWVLWIYDPSPKFPGHLPRRHHLVLAGIEQLLSGRLFHSYCRTPNKSPCSALD